METDRSGRGAQIRTEDILFPKQVAYRWPTPRCVVDAERIELSSTGCRPVILPLNDAPAGSYARGRAIVARQVEPPIASVYRYGFGGDGGLEAKVGVEPTTFALQERRATNCATRPKRVVVSVSILIIRGGWRSPPIGTDCVSFALAPECASVVACPAKCSLLSVPGSGEGI